VGTTKKLRQWLPLSKFEQLEQKMARQHEETMKLIKEENEKQIKLFRKENEERMEKITAMFNQLVKLGGGQVTISDKKAEELKEDDEEMTAEEDADIEPTTEEEVTAQKWNHIAFEAEDEHNTDEKESSMKLDPTEVTSSDKVQNENDSEQRKRIGTNKVEIEQWNCVGTQTTEVEQRKRIGTQTADDKQRGNCIGTNTTDVEQRKRIGPKMNDVEQKNIMGTNSGVQAKPWSFMIDEGQLAADIPFRLMHAGDQMSLYGRQWNPGIDRSHSNDSVTKTTLDYPNDVENNLVKSLIVKWTPFVPY